MHSFEPWWNVTFQGTWGLPSLEAAFKEVAQAAWNCEKEEFESFWEENFRGQLGQPSVEASFKEVAEKACHSS